MSRGARQTAGFLLGIAVILLLVYGRSLDNGFHYDDFHSIVENPHIRQLANIPAFFTRPEMFSGDPERGMYRPLLLATLALNYRVGGYRVAGYHLVNLGLHLVCALAVYLLGLRLGARRLAAAAGGVLFALHPLQTEVVNYISSRSESLAAAFFLASLLLYGRWRESRRMNLLLLSTASFAGALLSKSVAAVLPAALLLYEWADRRGEGRPFWRRIWPWHLGYWGVGAVYLLLAGNWLGGSLGHPVRPWGEQFWTQIKAGIYYLQLLFAPVELSVEHPFSVAEGPLSGSVFGPLLALASLVYLIGRRFDRVTLPLVWAVLPLLPSSLVPLNVLVNEHRLYLPLALLCTGAGVWLGGTDLLARRRRPLWLALLAVAGLLSWQRCAVWSDEVTLWRDAVAKGPGMYRTWMHLGGALEGQGEYAEALQAYARAVELEPEGIEPRYNLGNILRLLGRKGEAVAEYEAALHLDPGFVPALLNLSGLRLEAGEIEEAGDLLARGLARRPDMPELHRQLGIVRKRQGRLAEAEGELRRALELRPGWPEGNLALGNLYVAWGRVDEAIRAYEETLAGDPDYAAAYRNLGDLYLRTGELRRAAQLFRGGANRLPGERIFYYGLARAHEGMGEIGAAVTNYRRFLQENSLAPDAREAVRRHVLELEKRMTEGDETGP